MRKPQDDKPVKRTPRVSEHPLPMWGWVRRPHGPPWCGAWQWVSPAGVVTAVSTAAAPNAYHAALGRSPSARALSAN